MINLNELTLGQIKDLQNLINGTTKLTTKEDWGKQIVILQRGWVVLGDVTKEGEYFTVTNGFVIRRWGTKNGLGQLATEGKQTNTELEPTPKMRIHELTVINLIECDKDKWL